MSSDPASVFTKENLDIYLRELAKEFRKLNGTAISAEIILIGGAAILANYGFREMTTDIDVVMQTSSTMRSAINHVGDRFHLPNGWLNSDFMRTGSYSPNLRFYSKYYRTFSHVLHIRTISAEYLIAMKLRSGRKYKNDLSDIIGILAEHKKQGISITREQIETAVQNLYGGWSEFPTHSKKFIEDAFTTGNYEAVYQSVNIEEQQSKETLIHFDQKYPKVTTESNVNEILEQLKKSHFDSTIETAAKPQ
ncbi:MAG: DUF6036 family nucleotidyltransferase [Eubacteriales bacterium]|nr:DUF6036 family nucleotidyltransferase [Eubacteriales bacterium]